MKLYEFSKDDREKIKTLIESHFNWYSESYVKLTKNEPLTCDDLYILMDDLDKIVTINLDHLYLRDPIMCYIKRLTNIKSAIDCFLIVKNVYNSRYKK